MESDIASLNNEEMSSYLKPVFCRAFHQLSKYFDQTKDGIALAHQRALIIDQLLKILFNGALKKQQDITPKDLALLPIGGYGKSLLCPYSDIDLLFLKKDNDSSDFESIIRTIIYPLWDIGLKVSHTLVNTRQAMQKIEDDHVFATALLHSRLIAGSNDLFKNFMRRSRLFFSKTLEDRIRFIKLKISERDARHVRHLDTRYLLEPNIKNSKGGIRDLDFIEWFSTIYFNHDDLTLLEQNHCLTASELLQF
ncbi:MAG: hypothetical protein AAF403_07970, partial [Pseudomonadota bacterium]